MGLTNFLTNLIGPKVICNAIEKQDGESLGRDTAKVLDKIFDDQFGNDKSEKIQNVLIPFLNRFLIGLSEELVRDQNVVDNPT